MAALLLAVLLVAAAATPAASAGAAPSAELAAAQDTVAAAEGPQPVASIAGKPANATISGGGGGKSGNATGSGSGGKFGMIIVFREAATLVRLRLMCNASPLVYRWALVSRAGAGDCPLASFCGGMAQAAGREGARVTSPVPCLPRPPPKFTNATAHRPSHPRRLFYRGLRLPADCHMPGMCHRIYSQTIAGGWLHRFVRWSRQRLHRAPSHQPAATFHPALASSMHSHELNLDLPHPPVPGVAGEFTDADLARLERCLPSSIFYKEPDAQARPQLQLQGRHTGGVYGLRGCAGGLRAPPPASRGGAVNANQFLEPKRPRAAAALL